ncbi:hypothetical protein BAE40_30970, partial [Mesorhizobium loti]
MRAFLGRLRGEKRHCSMAALPTLEEEDARRPNRERQTLVGEQTRLVNRIKAILARFGIRSFRLSLRNAADRLIAIRIAEGTPLPDNTRAELHRLLERLDLLRAQIRTIEGDRLRRLAAAPAAPEGPHAMVRLIARVIGVGVETADMLVHKILSRRLRDRRAVARYAGLTGSLDESGKRRREKGLARAGSARVRHGVIQLGWRFLLFQKDGALARWFQARTADGRKATRKTMIVALARKLLIALWRLVTTGEAPQGVSLRAAWWEHVGRGEQRTPNWLARRRSADDDPRWRQPEATHGPQTADVEWARRPGASPTDAHSASWFRSPETGSAFVALPLWDQKNGAEQSNRRPDRNMRPQQQPCELAPSIVLRRTLSTGGGILLSPLALAILVANYAATGKLSRVQQNSVPSLHMRCMITASRRAKATTAFCLPRCLAIFTAQAFSQDHFLTLASRTCA